MAGCKADFLCTLVQIPASTPCVMWVKFVVDSLVCSERIFPRYSSCPLSPNTNISKFQVNQESGRQRTTEGKCYLYQNHYLFKFISSSFHLQYYYQPQKEKRKTKARENLVINSVMFLSNVIKIAKITVHEDVKPNLQPIRAKRCQMYCFWTNHRGTQREYSSKPLEYSIVKHILVLKQ